MKQRPLAALLLSFVLAACDGAGEKTPAMPAAAPPPPEVRVITAAAGETVLTRELPGRLQAVRTAQIRARVEGVVEKRLFAEGSDIAAGTPLFAIDDRIFRANADAARADLQVARQTFERYRPLLEARAVSQQEFELAQARVTQAAATLARAELDLRNAHVAAPISGRIGRALVTEGALVGKGEATHLATIE